MRVMRDKAEATTEATQFHHGAEIMHMASHAHAFICINRVLLVALNHTTTQATSKTHT